LGYIHAGSNPARSAKICHELTWQLTGAPTYRVSSRWSDLSKCSQ